jgi:NAD(P)-dependent dehydrogenase (short-subunit alcohol dehydrogenase family)
MGYWNDKVAIVTGASSGLGRTIAKAYAQAGARVVIAARGAEALQKIAAELRAAGHDCLAVATDVTQQEDVDSLLARTIEHYGRLDALVNNAGRSARRAVLDTTPEEFRELMELNLISVVRLTRAAAPHLLKRQGHLVNIGSLSGKIATRYMGAYPATKFALAAYSQQLRLELGSQGLHVLLVSPGPIARDEPRARPADELAGLPPSAARPGAGAKTRPIRPEQLAAAIVAACERRQSELVVPQAARWLAALGQLSPRLGDFIINKAT